MNTKALSSRRSSFPVGRSLRSIAAIAITGAFAACAAGNEASSSSDGSGGRSDPTGTGGSASSSSGSGEGGSLFDGGGPGEGGVAAGCQFVDLLFVIDNSPSMGKYQDELAKAFPSFVDAMFQKLPPNVDLHVGITTTSFFTGSCSESVSNCVSQASPQDIEAHYTKPTDMNNGTNGAQGRFFEYMGKKFYAANTSDVDQSGLKTWFAGAAVAAGETGCSFEMASAGAGYAAHPANSASNGGFFRDENGVLLVMVLSDEPDKSPEGTQVYKDMLTAVKPLCGGDKCILTAGLVNPCIEGVNNALWQFLHAFGEPPIWADLKDPSQYSSVVGDALAQVVKQTCDEVSIPK
jgi:hypothetical protein